MQILLIKKILVMLKRIWKFLILFTLSSFYFCTPMAQAEVGLNQLSAKLLVGEVRNLDIFAISSETLTGVSVTPELLSKNYHYKIELRDVGFILYQKSLVSVLQKISVKESIEKTDLRWGMIFYDGDMRKICVIYLNKYGTYGYVNSENVSFSVPFLNGNLASWLMENFSFK